MATTTSCENDLLAIYNRKRLKFTKMSAFCSPVFHNATKNVAWLEDDKNKGELHCITALSLLETVWALSIQVWLPLPCLTFSSIFRSIEPLLISFSSPSMLVRFRDSKLKFTEGGIREWYLYHVKSSCISCVSISLATNCDWSWVTLWRLSSAGNVSIPLWFVVA